MLYTKDLEDTILYIPALSSGSACNLIVLFDGIKEKKYVSRIRINLILGMTKGSSLTKKKA